MSSRIRGLFFPILLFSFLFSSPSFGKDIHYIQSGYLTGNTYREFSETEQMAYVMGLIDGAYLSPYFGAPDKGERITKLGSSTKGVSSTQLRAIVNKYLDEHPERWHYPMNTIFYSAIKEALLK